MRRWSNTVLDAGLRRLLCLVMGSLVASAVQASQWDFESLMRTLAQRRSAEARFTEERHVSGLEKPIRASGRLSFQAPDRFARHTELPRPESFEIEGSMATLKRGGRALRMSLDSVPEFGVLAEAIRGTLSGNALVLQQHFRIQLRGTAEAWTLSLRPVDERASAQLTEMILRGQFGDVRQIEARLPGGDRSVMQVDPPTPATEAPR